MHLQIEHYGKKNAFQVKQNDLWAEVKKCDVTAPSDVFAWYYSQPRSLRRLFPPPFLHIPREDL